jgi:purine-binding chemotaxis protein CheW
MVVDSVSKVLRVSEETVEPLPPMVNTVDSAFLKGIVRLEKRLIILLELGKVLNVEEQQALESIAAPRR